MINALLMTYLIIGELLLLVVVMHPQAQEKICHDTQGIRSWHWALACITFVGVWPLALLCARGIIR